MISEEKKKIVIENYFKGECNINMTIHDAYVKGFERGLSKAPQSERTGRWIPMEVSSGRDSWKCSVCGRRARGKLENLPYCHCGCKMEGEA